jgi:hypothetical protein
MDNIHGTHGTAGVVEDPLFIQINLPTGQLLLQFGHDEVDYRTRVIAVSFNGTQTQVMKEFWVEDVKPV